MDASTGDPLVPTTDHYDVSDWSALATALAAQSDVDGDRTAGWSRLREDADGQVRARAVINPNEGASRVTVLYRTAKLAEEGRRWFDALAGAAVRFRLQEVSDPKGVLSQPGALQPPREGKSGLPAGLDPEAAASVIEGAIRRSYARWADEPIPALGNRTPRDAIRTEAGLERVKGLLRSYEEGRDATGRAPGATANLLPVSLGRAGTGTIADLVSVTKARMRSPRADDTLDRARPRMPMAELRALEAAGQNDSVLHPCLPS